MESSHDVTPSVRPDAGGGCRSVAGKLVGTLFLLFFLGMGLLFVGLIVREAIREGATYLWERTECTVLASAVEQTGNDDQPYRLAVSYSYTFGGRDYSSTVVALDPAGSDNYSKIQRQAARYRVGGTATCYVNPDRPEQSVLLRKSLWFVLIVFFPMIFVAIGAGGIWFVWKREKPGPATVSISKKAVGRRRALLVPIVIGVLFTLIGGGLFLFIGLLPAVRLALAQGWIETPCTVISSTVRSHSTDDGTTYKVDILYEYRYEGASFRSNRYDFANFGSSGSAGKREIVSRYPAGSTAVCYVNPDDPPAAVLNRSFRLSYLVGLLPLLFLVAGLAVLRWGLKQRQTRLDRRAERPGPMPSSEPLPVGPVVLEAQASPVAKLAGMIFICLFWNGIVSVFVWQAISGWRRGDPNWFLTIFMIPFVLVGIGFVVGVFHRLLALFNPRPHITLDPGAVRLGDTLNLGWRITGRASRIDRLKITLEAREEATYRRGTDTRTDREVFLSITVAEVDNDFEIQRGEAVVHVPEDTMHSFSGTNNKIVWTLKAAGDIPRWPDVDEDFELEVRPLPLEGVAR